MQEARNRHFRVSGRLLLLEPLAGVGMHAQPGRGPTDAGVLEIRAFEQQTRGGRADLAVQAAHDAGQRDRLALVPDHQVVGLHLAILPVQSREAALRAERGHAHRTQPAGVERVHGLAEFQHDVVGEIDQDVERALSQGVQAGLQRQRRGQRRHPVQFDAAVAGTAVRIVHRQRVRRQIVVCGQFGARQRPQGTRENGGHFAGDPVVAPQVGAMGDALVVDFEQGVGRGNEIGQRAAGFEAVGQIQDAEVSAAHAHLVGRAQHAPTGSAADSAFGNGPPVGERHPGRGERRGHPDPHVGRAADGRHPFGAARHGHERLPAVQRLDRLHARDPYAGETPGERMDALDLRRRHGQPLGNRVGRQVGDIDVLADPVEGDVHREFLRSGQAGYTAAGNCSQKRRSPAFRSRMSGMLYFIIASRVRPRPNAKPL